MKKYKYLFLVKNGNPEFRCDYVEFHMDLLSDKELTGCATNGGGEFNLDFDNKEIILYGRSCDYGRPREIENTIQKCYDQILDAVDDFWWCYTETDYNFKNFKIAYLDDYKEKHVVKKKK